MRSNKERSIERYINGRMGPAEQREFLKQAERDPSIRRMLKAEQVIGNAIARDRAALPLVAMEPGAGLLSKLAVTKPAGVGSAAGAGSAAGNGGAGVGAGSTIAGASAGSGAAGSMVGTGVVGGATAGGVVAGGAAASSGIIGSLLLGSKIAQVIVAVVGISGIAVGTFMVAPVIQRSTSHGNEPTPVERKMELRTPPSAPQVNAAQAPTEAASPAVAPNDQEATAATPEATPRLNRTSLALRKHAPQESAPGEVHAKAPAKQQVTSATAPAKADPPPPEIEDRNASVKIRMEKGNK